MAADPLNSIISALKREQILPDVLPDGAASTPSVLFSVVYPNGAEVNLGNHLTVEDTQDEPEIRLAALTGPWDDAGAGEASYTLAPTRPRAASPSTAPSATGSFITGLKSPALTANAAGALNALKTHPATTLYRPHGPRTNSGLHRYIFLLFQEPTSASAQPSVVPQGAPEYGAALETRRSWSPTGFAEKYGLKLVGANYFLLQSPEAAPQ